MGVMSQYQCPGCGYESEMVCGARDRGFHVELETFACKECGVLFDVEIGKPTQDGFVPSPEKPRCSKSKKHTISPWVLGAPCPRCGGVDVKPGGESCLWD